MVQRLINALENERTTDNFNILLHRNIRISTDLGIVPVTKRIVKRQQNHTNPLVEDTEAHYRVGYYYAFLDNTISYLNTICL